MSARHLPSSTKIGGPSHQQPHQLEHKALVPVTVLFRQENLVMEGALEMEVAALVETLAIHPLVATNSQVVVLDKEEQPSFSLYRCWQDS